VFDADMAAAGTVHPFSGPCAADEVDADGHPTGPWSASHTYPNLQAVPAKVCANFYDIHGTPGSPLVRDLDPLNNADNSIRTNNFNVGAADGMCFSTGVSGSDVEPPTVTGTPDRSPNAAGWYDAPVTITWSAVDPDPSSGLATQPAPTVANIEGAGVVYASEPSCDPAGNCASGSLALSIDMTPPTVAYVGNAGTYTVDEQISIFCVADDVVSGIVSSTCADVNAPAYSFVGTSTYSATATDTAGNTATAETSFTVVVTPGSLANVTASLVTDPGVAGALTATLTHGQINAFINQVQAQSGKKIGTSDADTLLALAGQL
jgi:hypothetical protein